MAADESRPRERPRSGSTTATGPRLQFRQFANRLPANRGRHGQQSETWAGHGIIIRATARAFRHAVAAKIRHGDLPAYGLPIGLLLGFGTDAIVTAAGV